LYLCLYLNLDSLTCVAPLGIYSRALSEKLCHQAKAKAQVRLWQMGYVFGAPKARDYQLPISMSMSMSTTPQPRWASAGPMSAKVPTAVPDPRSPSQWPGLNGKVSWLSGPEGQFLIFSGDRWKRMGRGTVVKNGLHPLSTH